MQLDPSTGLPTFENKTRQISCGYFFNKLDVIEICAKIKAKGMVYNPLTTSVESLPCSRDLPYPQG